jgi:glutaminase
MEPGSSRRRIVGESLGAVHERLAGLAEGAVAGYIPQLSHADPKAFGLALCSVNGFAYSSGDADVPFTIQSASKPFVYALALDDRGLDRVLESVGAEPSGEAFNSVKLDATGRPPNPMVNAGAIVTASLVAGESAAERFGRIRDRLGAFAGRELAVDEAVFASELQTGDRNRALGYLMRASGALDADVGETLEVYFRQCALLVSSVDLAVMGATLANGGVNPVTGVRATSEQTSRHVLTVMATCGMYDFSGEWLLRVGLYSPPLDENGNSVRATEAARHLAERLGLHMMHHPIGLVALDEGDTAGAAGAYRAELEASLAALPGPARAWSLRGHLDFAATERLLDRIDAWLEGWGTDSAGRPTVVLDFSAVTELHPVAGRMLAAAARLYEAAGADLVVRDPDLPGSAASLTTATELIARRRAPRP